MPRKGSTGGSSPGPEPTGNPDLDKVIRELTDNAAAIAAHEKMRRELPLRVLGPQLDDALDAARKKFAELALPETAVPPLLEKFPVGKKVVVTLSPEQSAIVLGPSREKETGKEARLLFTEKGQFIVATVEELEKMAGEAAASTQPSPFLPAMSPPETGSAAQVFSPSGIRPGDTVTSPAGTGKVVREVEGNPGVYEVMLPTGSTMFFKSGDLTVVPPA